MSFKAKLYFLAVSVETFGPANGLPIPSRSSLSLSSISIDCVTDSAILLLSHFHHFEVFPPFDKEQRKAFFMEISFKSLKKNHFAFLIFFALLLCKSTVFQIFRFIFFVYNFFLSFFVGVEHKHSFCTFSTHFFFFNTLALGFEWQGDVEATEKRSDGDVFVLRRVENKEGIIRRQKCVEESDFRCCV